MAERHSLKVFIASSSKGRHLAEAVHQIVSNAGAGARGWWEDEAFPVNVGFLESLHRNVRDCNCAIAIATADDIVRIQNSDEWQARGNVLLEYGMFAGAHGRERVALCVAGPVSLPSDLDGVHHVELQDCDLVAPGAPMDSAECAEFIDSNTPRIRRWLIDRDPTHPEYRPKHNVSGCWKCRWTPEHGEQAEDNIALFVDREGHLVGTGLGHAFGTALVTGRVTDHAITLQYSGWGKTAGLVGNVILKRYPVGGELDGHYAQIGAKGEIERGTVTCEKIMF